MKPQLTTWALTLSPEDPGTWQPTFDGVVAADRAGVDRVALTGEHVLFGEHLEAYSKPELGGREGAKQATGADGHYIEPIVTMSMIAALTKRVRFTTNIMLAALRRPVVLAKMTSTLDVLSGGRLDLGVGVGWQREEYEASGLEFEKRGRLLDHSLEVCQLLWREQRATYSSPELSFENIHMMPKPVDPAGVPIWVSGTVAPPSMRRLARFGAGWIPWGDAALSAEGLVAAIPQMREAVAKFGGDPLKVQVAGTLPIVNGSDGQPAIGPTMDKVPALVAAGVTDFRAQLPLPRDINAAEDYLTPWVQAFRAATA
ncbi:MAG TPA: TIGR03619 family F420-dependent LLM class oxidoreductase [Sphingobium sp.]|nr:TIGR03619 family F420-dependent LLM class oxidoreductase [Sphingobium sp.]